MAVLSVGVTLLVALSIGPVSFFTSREHFGGLLIGHFGDVMYQVVAALMRVPVLVAAVGMIYLNRTIGSVSLARRAATWGMAGLALIVTSPVITPRFLAGTAVLCLWFALTRPTVRRQRVLVWGLPSMLLLVFPYADLFRRVDSELAWRGVAEQLSAKGDFDAFQEIVRSLSFVSDMGHTYGLQLLGALLFFVPRFMWPGKPISTGTEVARHAGSNWENVSSPLWLETYVDFGLVGMLIIFVALGWALVAYDRRCDAGFRGGGQWWSVLGPLVAFYSIVLYRGSLESMAPGIVLIVLCCLFIRDARPPAASPPHESRSQARSTALADSVSGADQSRR
ncbi:O-antigen polymerase [Actinopolymorpha pittospori]